MHNVLHTNSLWAATPSVCRMSNTYHISAYTRRRHSRVIHPCHVDIRPTMCNARRFRLSICLFISAEVGLLCKQVFLDLGKTNIGDLLAIIYHSTSCGSCTECSKLLWVGDWRVTVTLLRQILFSFPGLANLVYLFKGDCLQVLSFRNNLPHIFMGGKD